MQMFSGKLIIRIKSELVLVLLLPEHLLEKTEFSVWKKRKTEG